MRLSQLAPSELVRYEKEKQQKIQKLKRIKAHELINRILAYACILPFLHMTTCVGQRKPVPTVSKVGGAGFAVCAVRAFSLRKKEEQATSDLYGFFDRYSQQKD